MEISEEYQNTLRRMVNMLSWVERFVLELEHAIFKDIGKYFFLYSPLRAGKGWPSGALSPRYPAPPHPPRSLRSRGGETGSAGIHGWYSGCVVMWLYVTVLFGDPVDLTQLKLQLETAVTSKKLKEMIYKIKNIVAKRGNLPNGEPLWGRDVEAISSKLYNLCRAERLQWSGSPESARFKLSNITRELRLIFASHDPSQNETLKRKLDSTMDVPDRARVEERSQRLKLLEDEYTTSLAEIGGMDTNSMSASSSMTFMDG